MKHLGDITKINGDVVPAVDIICGGSPCQDLSVAGKRAGLAGERSGLFMEQVRIIKEMRKNGRTDGRTDEHIRFGRFLVWENVPGAFSSPGGSHKGEDFQAVLTEIVRIAKADAPDVPLPKDRRWPHAGCLMGIGDNGQPFSVAYRLHDAQFWGVPQRRKRIALVADFGGTAAPEILFERESVSGDSEQSWEEGERTTQNIERCADSSSYTLKIRGGIAVDSNGRAAGKGPLVQTELSGTLGVSQDQTLITSVIGFNRERCGEVTMDDAMPTLQAAAGESGNNKPMVCLNDQGGQQMSVTENVSGTLRAQEHGHQPIVFEPGAASRVGGHAYEDVAGTVRANAGDNQQAVVYNGAAVTSPINASNPLPGDPCHTLTEDSRNYLVQAAGVDTNNQTMDDEIAQPLRAADGGDSTPKVVCIEGNGSRPSHQGDGYAESETMYTLNSTEHHAVVAEPITASKASYFMKQHNNGKAETLVATDYKDPQIVSYGLDRASYNQGMNAKYDFSIEEEKIGTQVAKGPGAVCKNVVRRLTPMECERLQGFPDGWTDIGDWIDTKGKCTRGILTARVTRHSAIRSRYRSGSGWRNEW